MSFFAEGLPKGQPRPKACIRGKHAGVYDPGTAEDWKTIVRYAAHAKRPEKPFAGPLQVTLAFQFPRPKGHFGTGKNAGKLKDGLSDHHTSKPDIDNCAKAVLDALAHMGVWGDDAQISILVLAKRYDSKPGCHVRIESLT